MASQTDREKQDRDQRGGVNPTNTKPHSGSGTVKGPHAHTKEGPGKQSGAMTRWKQFDF
jgi:hypothetical protein